MNPVRRIFTMQEPDGEHRIVARGPDRQFGIDQIVGTSGATIAMNTVGPYIVSPESRAPVVFIAALTPEKLLVVSNFSPLGREAVAVARAHLKTSLARKGLTEAHLASVLRARNWTAVAQLRDDSTADHKPDVAYPPELTGLHLHAINECTAAFKTLPHVEVNAFAAEWGFIPAPSRELESIAAVRAFADELAQTGEWNGLPVDRIVVCAHHAPPPPVASASGSSTRLPYAPGAPFFFTIPAAGPPSVYFHWRRLTASLLRMMWKGGADKLDLGRLPGLLGTEETTMYARWVIEQLQRDPGAFVELHRTKGTAAVREHFLSEFKSSEEKQEGISPVYARGLSGRSRARLRRLRNAVGTRGSRGCGSASPHVSHGVDLQSSGRYDCPAREYRNMRTGW
ncbi:RNA ligase-domain-containing protein [Mycena rosella]|uniref:RNA ligase-domain-containing protein n=1 Tax=Mycena rosella TaxID=1033263 RepID=A0AAD7FRL8_MYCRO|nr:RNA ligase-domain-containing protein [Mycena rosella]